MAILATLLIANLLLATVVQTVGRSRAEEERDMLRKRYGAIVDVDAAKAEAEAELARIETRRSELAALLVCEEGWAEQQEFGVYEPQYDCEEDEEYKSALQEAREEQRELTRSGEAVVTLVQGGDQGSSKVLRNFMKLMLRAFNGQAEAAIATVTQRNVRSKLDRLDKLVAGINKLGQVVYAEISPAYLESKKKELRLVHERALFRERQREQGNNDQRDYKREERARGREFADAQRLVALNRDAVAAIEKKIRAAADAELERLQKQLREAEAALSASTRAVAQAQLTRAGYVYVLSNVGSFGEEVFSVGMTRRLVPQKRVDELGDASVPFPFDVHAMIYSPDAPGLKAALQQSLETYRMNRVNVRKDFFRVGLDEIASALRALDVDPSQLQPAEAREYHESLAQAGALLSAS